MKKRILIPLGSVGMSYDAGDNYNIEKPLTGL